MAKEATVRVLSRGAGVPVGGGVLIDSERVVTCYHVLCDAAAAPSDGVALGETFDLDFPLAGGEIAPKFTGVVVAVRRASDQPPQSDLAVLKLDRPVEDVREPVFDHSVPPRGDVFTALGFPNGEPQGDWAEGTYLGRLGSKWIQVKSDDLHHGFSGTPAWNEPHEAVGGIIVEANAQGKGLIIPAGVLREFAGGVPGVAVVDLPAERVLPFPRLGWLAPELELVPPATLSLAGVDLVVFRELVDGLRKELGARRLWMASVVVAGVASTGVVTSQLLVLQATWAVLAGLGILALTLLGLLRLDRIFPARRLSERLLSDVSRGTLTHASLSFYAARLEGKKRNKPKERDAVR